MWAAALRGDGVLGDRRRETVGSRPRAGVRLHLEERAEDRVLEDLEKVEGNARLVRDSVAEEVAKLKEQPGKDLAVGGAGLAAHPHEAGSHRRVPAVRQSGCTGRRYALLPGPGREDQPGAGRDTDVWLSRGLRSLPACVMRPSSRQPEP